MITFEIYFKEKLKENCLRHKITSPKKPIVRIEYRPSTMSYLLSGTACIFSLSEYLSAQPAIVDVLYILIKDTEDEFDDSSIRNFVLLQDCVNKEELFIQTLSLLESSRLIDSAYTSITSELFNNASIKALLKTASELIGNPIFLSDNTTKMLECSDTDELAQVNDELIACILKNGFITADLFEKYDYAHLLKEIAKSRKAFFLESRYPEKLNRLIVTVNVNSRYFGWLIAIPYKRDFKPEHCEIMDILSNAVSIGLERNKTSLAVSSSENLLMELLTGRFESKDEFLRRVKGFGWTLKDSYNAIVIGYKNPTEHNTQHGIRTMMAYKNHLSLIFPAIKSIYTNERLVMLVENIALTQVMYNLEIFITNNNLAASVSNTFSSIIDFREYYEQSSDILNLGLELNKDKSIFYYHEMYLYHCFYSLKKSGRLEHYCMPELKEIMQYDKTYKTNLAETVRAYLNFRNFNDTAEYLKIHRNTLVYRLGKFKELTNLDLSSGDDIYRLWLSFLILDLFRKSLI